MDVKISFKRFNNKTNEENDALNNLRDEPLTIIVKGADKRCTVDGWDREDTWNEWLSNF